MQNLDAEESILGAMMLSRFAIEAVAGVVSPGDFYRESHGRIFQAAVDLHQQGEPVDAITLANELERRGQLDEIVNGETRGRARLHEIAALVPATSNARHYARIVSEMAMHRRLIEVGATIKRLACEPGDTATKIEQAERLLVALRTSMPGDAGWLARASDLLSTPAPGPTPFLVERLIVDGAVGTILGPPKDGKTFLVLELAVAVATGSPALGRFAVPKPGPVIVILEESGLEALHRRLDQLARGKGLRPDALADLHFAANARVRLDDPGWRERLLQAGRELRPRLILLDPLARLKGAVDENAQKEIGPLLDFLRDLRDASGAAVVFVHHVGHNSSHLRGSSDLEAYWESRIALRRDDRGIVELTAEHREAEGGLLLHYRLEPDTATETLKLIPVADTEDKAAPRDLERDIRDLLSDGQWRTTTEIATKGKGGVGVQRTTVGKILDDLVASGAVETQKGPEGRGKDAIGFRAVVPVQGQAGTSGSEGTSDCLSAEPLSPVGGGFAGQAELTLVPDAGHTRLDARRAGTP